jgi:hypothetical protein
MYAHMHIRANFESISREIIGALGKSAFYRQDVQSVSSILP